MYSKINLHRDYETVFIAWIYYYSQGQENVCLASEDENIFDYYYVEFVRPWPNMNNNLSTYMNTLFNIVIFIWWIQELDKN